MIEHSDWRPAMTAPMDGTPIEVRFMDNRGEYRGFPILWDNDSKCWRNFACKTRIDVSIARWRPYAPNRQRVRR